MVTKYGMSEALGKVAINYEDNGRSVSSETRNLVETEVRLIRPSLSSLISQWQRWLTCCMLQSPSPTHSSAAGTGGSVDDTLCLFAEQIAAVYTVSKT